MDDNPFQGPYVYVPPALAVSHPRQPNDVTHLVGVWSIYDRTDYLVNLDPRYIEALSRSYRVSELIEGEMRTGLPPNDSRPVYTPLAIWRSKIPKERR